MVHSFIAVAVPGKSVLIAIATAVAVSLGLANDGALLRAAVDSAAALGAESSISVSSHEGNAGSATNAVDVATSGEATLALGAGASSSVQADVAAEGAIQASTGGATVDLSSGIALDAGLDASVLSEVGTTASTRVLR
jgi:hypothetical protein